MLIRPKLIITVLAGTLLVTAVFAALSLPIWINQTPPANNEPTLMESLVDPSGEVAGSNLFVGGMAEQDLMRRAVTIRTVYKSWAMTHRAKIAELSALSGKAESKIAGFVQSVSLSSGRGADGCLPATLLNSSYGVFSWNCAPGSAKIWNKSDSAYNLPDAESDRYEDLLLYARWHDVIIAQSATPNTLIAVWASGRVTSGPTKRKLPKATGQCGYVEYLARQIMPPFKLVDRRD